MLPLAQWESCRTPSRSEGDIHAQVLLIQAIPCGGQVMGGDGAGEHLLFQLIANHDVQAVGELIGLGADQRGPGRFTIR